MVAVALKAPPKKSAVSRVTQWCTKRVADGIEQGIEVDLVALGEEACEWVLSDPELNRAYVQQTLPQSVYDTGQRVVALTRRQNPKWSPMLVADTILPPGKVARGVKRLMQRFDFNRWIERVGPNAHKRVRDMVKGEFRGAAEYRYASGEHDVALADLWMRVDAELEEGQAAGDRYGNEHLSEQLNEMYAEIEQRIKEEREKRS